MQGGKGKEKKGICNKTQSQSVLKDIEILAGYSLTYPNHSGFVLHCLNRSFFGLEYPTLGL